MPAYYRRSLKEFVESSPNSIVGELAAANAQARFRLEPEAILAWANQLPPLCAGFASLIESVPGSADWNVLLEYPIPIVGRRIDAVLIAHDAIVVIETKTGLSPTSAARQVDDYALNLACFHEGSCKQKIVPLVISDAVTARNTATTRFDSLVEPCHISTSSNFSQVLNEIVSTYVDLLSPAIDPASWDVGRFRPIPPIVDAAIALYSNKDVFEIEHACAARPDLDSTTAAIVEAVTEAREKRQKIICFVTGVPGAGKTLVGLNAVHRPELKNAALFLSGNGPLVKVIREALVRDVVRRSGETRVQAELEVQAFVQNVHRFADQYYGGGSPVPAQNVVVFDEAQRAWDANQNERAKRPSVSEAQMMIEVMDRHTDWAVIVALVGGGQEINRGEAGLGEWGRALQKFRHWHVYASDQVLSGGDSTAGFKLFEENDRHPNRIHNSRALHLTVCTRSIRAQKMSDWVNAILCGNSEEAQLLARDFEARPLITRSLTDARGWLAAQRRGTTRAGLVCSSSAARLRADGIDFRFSSKI